MQLDPASSRGVAWSERMETGETEVYQSPDQVSTENPQAENPVAEPGAVGKADGSPVEGKNARKKRERRNRLPHEPIFNFSKDSSTDKDKSSSDKGGTQKAFPFAKYRQTARNHAQLISGFVDKYFELRGAQCVVPMGNGAAQIVPMTCERIGEIVYYTDKSIGIVKGPIGEAVAFHLVVAGEGSLNWLDGFVERHRGGVSMFAVCAIAVYIETAMRQNAMIIEAIERKARESADRPEVESEGIEIK